MEKRLVKLGKLCCTQYTYLQSNRMLEYLTNGQAVSAEADCIVMADNQMESYTRYYKQTPPKVAGTYTIISCSPELNTKYLFYLLSNGMKAYINQMASKHPDQKIDMDDLTECKVYLPPLKEQLDLVNTMDTLHSTDDYLRY